MRTHPWGGETLAPEDLKAALRVWRLIKPTITRAHRFSTRMDVEQLRHWNPALPSATTVTRWVTRYDQQGLRGLVDGRSAEFLITDAVARNALFFIKSHLLRDPDWLDWLASVATKGTGSRKLTPAKMRCLLAQMQIPADGDDGDEH